MTRTVHVLVVDDSAVVREIVGQILTSEPDMTVALASDPIIAQEKMRAQRPDVVLLDLEMPRMDGLTFLEAVMRDSPLPVVVCSSLAGPGTENALAALDLGAVDVIAKPQLGIRDFLHESAIRLVDAVRAATRTRRFPDRRPRRAHVEKHGSPLIRHTTDRVVAIGASTGGTEAIRTILEGMPVDSPGLVLVQHMPAGFTAAFARRLDESCAIEVREAASGDRIVGGRALIAPGDRHLTVIRSGAHYVVDVTDGPPVSRHRPSVDVLFGSVARSAGPNAVGVILTGMGDDGAAGLLAMRGRGAATLAQDEASCVVFGMPKEAIARGAAETVLSLRELPAAILRAAATPREGAPRT